MRPICRLVLFSASVVGCAVFRPSTVAGPKNANTRLARSIDSMIGSRDFRSANWGILIVDPERGDTLYSHNAEKLFIPASNQKLVVSSVMLERSGPEYRYKTFVVAQGRVADGTLDGNLAVIGRGDPTSSNRMKGDAMLPLRAMADSLWQRGIRHITGDIVAFGDAMPGPVAGGGWPWDALDGNSYAGVDELLFNEGLTTIRVRPGPGIGSPAVVETGPAKTYPVVRINALTVAADSTASSTAGRGGRGGGRGGRGGAGTRLTVHNDTGSATVTLRGQIAMGDSATLTIAQHDPDAAYVAALAEALRDRGIVVEHNKPEPYAGRADTLLTLQSVPLREILPAIMKPSQNQIAETFLRTIGLEGTGIGTADSGRRVIERQFADWKIAPDGFVVRDGSGLSRSDLISPETIVRILDHMRRSPNFQIFYDALPIAGVDGTIGTRMRNTPAQGNLHAKTGTLQMVRSLSGYVTTADKRLLEFSILCNNWTTPQADVDRVGDAIGAMLAGEGRR
ncbi:MAG TPA: D-alanyl-D-alanine carboxypeptidase/D-alanyl-D-alanine-endopeptidase [Gemmatimonadaceae bacterium]|jgi:D-alanyl-D-alanine carboxypeptidase/D-alanyl-D-alanine-endopeptidase (penicillin-binding protein 4)|nr:D-alanyl-D-alanine carboxypeptidase/D-alanyl-D-alanine-endopeptidase [Gemmatimonadaceae bacterium]